MPPYRIEYRPRSLRDLGKLEKNLRARVFSAIDDLAANPRPQGSTKLTETEDLYRVKEGGYRIVYQIRDESLIVLVVKVGHRREVYRKLAGVVRALPKRRKGK